MSSERCLGLARLGGRQCFGLPRLVLRRCTDEAAPSAPHAGAVSQGGSQATPSVTSKRVVIAGGGFAALEAALALRALASDRVSLMLISPRPGFVYRPAATVEAFDEPPGFGFHLAESAADLGATYHRAALGSVAPRQQRVRLEPEMILDYDFLILALGAQTRTGIPGALTFRDQRDLRRIRTLLDQLRSGAISRLVFAVPSPASWSLPAYELAFLSATYVQKHSVRAELIIVSPEPTPLAVFGDHASAIVASRLEDRGIKFVSALPHSVRRDGALAVQFDGAIQADRVVAVPELHGPRVAGLPGNWSGFVPTDSCGRVEGLANVYAAGDMTAYPVKQGGIAAQQADVIAQTIAGELGAPVKELRNTMILRARLLDGEGALVLRTELDPLGRPTGATIERRESRQAGDLKVFGTYLTPYLSIYRSRHESAA
jgi:sulfide:quinone oxidoreductase